MHTIAKLLTPSPLWRWLHKAKTAYRGRKLVKPYRDGYIRLARSVYQSVRTTGEVHNFTYDLVDRNLGYLADTIAVVLNKPREEIATYIREAQSDDDINARARALVLNTSSECLFGRRLGWYAVARALKPAVVVETGVDRGHGSLILCAALLRNKDEGFPGRYFGTDLRPDAGELLTGNYAEVGNILYGDSISSLAALNEKIDLFINDSDHSAEYEYREYKQIASKLANGAIILGDNSHVTEKLAQFSRESGRKFIFFKEEPKGHWYPGAGIGFSF